MREPQLADFGLSTADIETIKAKGTANDRVSSKLSLWLIAGIFGGGFLWACAHSGNYGVFILLIITTMTGLVAIMIGFIPAVIISMLVAHVIAPLHPEAKILRRYEKAMSAFKAAWAREQVAFWQGLSGPALERELSLLLQCLGHSVHLVGGAGDGRVDLLVDDDIIIQCKAHAKPLSPAAARDLLGTKIHRGAQRAVLVCTGGFSRATQEFANANKLELWDVQALVSKQRGVNA